MRILVYNASWSNAGNGWFAASCRNLLRSMYPDAIVRDGEDDIVGNFRPRFKFERKNGFSLMHYQRADLHVLCGPMLPPCTPTQVWGQKIMDIIAHGEKYCIISASGTGMTRDAQRTVSELLVKYPPLFVTTRDEESYLWLKENGVKHLYNGICTAWLVDRTIQPHGFESEKPYFISSWYTELDPVYYLEYGDECNVETIRLHRKKTYLHLPYGIARHFNFMRPQQVEVGGMKIVRTIQNINTRFNHINFAMPNSFISFNPENYIDVVKSCEFTVSDRVHACVISLACGHPCRFLYETPRSGIFTRMGYDFRKTGGVMFPNMERVDEEMELLKKEIRKYLG